MLFLNLIAVIFLNFSPLKAAENIKNFDGFAPILSVAVEVRQTHILEFCDPQTLLNLRFNPSFIQIEESLWIQRIYKNYPRFKILNPDKDYKGIAS